MKIFLVVLLVLCSCKYIKVKEGESLTDSEWHYVLGEALMFNGLLGKRLYLYQKYENKELNKLIKHLYINGHKLYNYTLNDSIIYNIENRNNNSITNSIDTISVLNIDFINDTTDSNQEYILISEPIRIKNNIILFSLTRKRYNSCKREHWLYFFKKKDRYRLLSGYDYQKGEFFETVEAI